MLLLLTSYVELETLICNKLFEVSKQFIILHNTDWLTDNKIDKIDKNVIFLYQNKAYIHKQLIMF